MYVNYILYTVVFSVCLCVCVCVCMYVCVCVCAHACLPRRGHGLPCWTVSMTSCTDTPRACWEWASGLTMTGQRTATPTEACWSPSRSLFLLLTSQSLGIHQSERRGRDCARVEMEWIQTWSISFENVQTFPNDTEVTGRGTWVGPSPPTSTTRHGRL